MRIERVDDTTVKLFITYSDIEQEVLNEKIYGLIANVEKNSFGT